MKSRVEQRLNELIDQLSGMVDRAFQKHGFNRKKLKFDYLSDRKIEAMALEARMWGGQEVPRCPVCGVNPHNWAIHEEWRRLPGAQSEDKVAADREVYPAHECVDWPTLQCPACLKWTGDGFATVETIPNAFPVSSYPNESRETGWN